MDQASVRPDSQIQSLSSSDDQRAGLRRGVGIYLFLSIDMENSTAFKGKEPHWPFVMHAFYEEVVRQIRSICPHFNVWKYIGDEVTFWRRLNCEDDVVRLVSDIHDALHRICQMLDEIEDQHQIRTKNLISAKATIWIAAAEFAKDDRHEPIPKLHANRVIEEEHMITLSPGDTLREIKIYDFIGPDIDIGFRISHFAHRGFLLVSAGLCYFLATQAKSIELIAQRMKIVSYQRLKGVWSDRQYPIVWYTDDWENAHAKFDYDEHWNNPVVAGVCSGKFDEISKIELILRQTNQLETIDAAIESMVAECEVDG